MPSITLSVPERVRELMKQFPEVNWSGFVRGSIEAKVRGLLWKQQMMEKLESEEPFDKLALEIGDKIKEGAWKRLKTEGW